MALPHSPRSSRVTPIPRITFSLLLLGFMLTNSAGASTIHVSGAAPAGGDGKSWDTALRTITGALAAASVGDAIWVAQGTYSEAIELKSGVSLYGGFAGDETDLTTRDITAHPTIIDASTANGGQPADHAILMEYIGWLTLDGFTVTGGAPLDYSYGGGLFCLDMDGPTTISQCTFTGNRATWGGGASLIHSSPAIVRCIFSNNTGGDGGGVYVTGYSCYLGECAPSFTDCTFSSNTSFAGGGLYSDCATPTLLHCVFTKNKADEDGGGIAFEKGLDEAEVSLVMSRCTLQENSAKFGGGLSVVMSAFNHESGLISLTDCSIIDNQALDGGGGGVQGFGASIKLKRCLVRGNSALGKQGWGGGGLALAGGGWDNDGSSPVVDQCTIIGNSADLAGGILFYRNNATIVRSIIAGNRAKTYGGGMFNSGPTSATTISQCVISGNQCETWGGGIAFGDITSTTLVNCMISGNASLIGGGVWCFHDAIPLITNCTISSNTAADGGGINVTDKSAPAIQNTIFHNNAGYGIFEADATSDPTVSHCLFNANSPGDYFDERTTALKGAASINQKLPGATANVDGAPNFVLGAGGQWTAPPVFDPATTQTTLTNSAANLTPGALAGRMINPDLSQRSQAYVLANTESTLTVLGDLTKIAGSGKYYRIADYHLTLDSPAIDAGASDHAPLTDFEGRRRPVMIDAHRPGGEDPQNAFDIGAFEFQLPYSAIQETWALYH